MVPLEEIFCLIDDFCKQFEQEQQSRLLPNPARKRKRHCSLCISEIITIMIMFHLSHYRTFKDFYLECLVSRYKNEFPKLVSYNRFLELIPYTAMPVYILISQLTGKYYIDSTKLQVCDNLRIHSHKVFEDIVKRGKTSTGWFFGFKLHLIINNQGEIMNFRITSGNRDDRSVVKKMADGLTGWLFGDKGYVSKKLTNELEEQGLELLTKTRKNMGKSYLSPLKKLWLDKRGIIESVIDQFKALLHIQHTRHRSPNNFLANLLAGIAAYIFKPKKPSISFAQSLTAKIFLTSS